jgi:hypothetical protein
VFRCFKEHDYWSLAAFNPLGGDFVDLTNICYDIIRDCSNNTFDEKNAFRSRLAWLFDDAGADLQSVPFLTGICNAIGTARKGIIIKPGNFRNCQALLLKLRLQTITG